MAKGAHHWIATARGWAPWWYCCKCGLVRLKNETTRRAEVKRCESDED